MTRQEIEQLDEALREMEEMTYHERTLLMREEFETRDDCEYLGNGMYLRGRNSLDELV
jgi:hypothetical protein